MSGKEVNALSNQPTFRPFIPPNSPQLHLGTFFFPPASDQRRCKMPSAAAAVDEAAAAERVQCDGKKNSRKPEGLCL